MNNERAVQGKKKLQKKRRKGLRKKEGMKK